ncbi:hypothetical protein ACN20G_23340 [Streptomyces sp. BI20]|uniref:hypothetical protein n=1 Tax=Streptomyces sp. BI20 TaxID=3403460 RepID=UPI003C75CD95
MSLTKEYAELEELVIETAEDHAHYPDTSERMTAMTHLFREIGWTVGRSRFHDRPMVTRQLVQVASETYVATRRAIAAERRAVAA